LWKKQIEQGLLKSKKKIGDNQACFKDTGIELRFGKKMLYILSFKAFFRIMVA